MSETIKYLKTESGKLYQDSTSTSSKKVITELLWGDRLVLLSDNQVDGRYKVRVRGLYGYVDADLLGDEALLEIYFIDVGQGDGLLVITPERKHILIDGGYIRAKQPHGKNAADFVDWKFKKDYGMDTIELDAMVCSHCDADHYGGLWDHLNPNEKYELDTTGINVKHFYHAGVSWFKTAQKSRFLGREEDGYMHDLLEVKTSITDGNKILCAILNEGKSKWEIQTFESRF